MNGLLFRFVHRLRCAASCRSVGAQTSPKAKVPDLQPRCVFRSSIPTYRLKANTIRTSGERQQTETMNGLLFRFVHQLRLRGFSAGRPKPVVGAQPPPRDQRNPSCGNCVFDVLRKSSKNRGMSKTIVEAYPRKRACLRTRAAHWKSSHPEDRTPYMLLQDGSAKMTQPKLSDDTMFQTGSHSIFSSGGGEVDVLGHLLTTTKPPHTVARAYKCALFRRALFSVGPAKGSPARRSPDCFHPKERRALFSVGVRQRVTSPARRSPHNPGQHQSHIALDSLSTQRNVPTA